MRLVSTVAALALFAQPLWADESHPTLTVSGEGQISVVPDLATISLGVTVQGDTAKAALDANSAALSSVIDRLKAAGIEGKDIQTSGLSLGPVFDYSASSGGPQKVLGYSASNMLTVQVHDIAKVGGVLDSAVTDGANTLNGISFGLADPAPATDEARVKAVENARHKAELLAGAAGMKLGPVLSISENGGFSGPVPMAAAAFDKAGAVPVEAGQSMIGASVSVTYSLTE